MKYYIILEVDNGIRTPISVTNKPDRYGVPRLFGTKKAAQNWINKRIYKGMSYHYEIIESAQLVTKAGDKK